MRLYVDLLNRNLVLPSRYVQPLSGLTAKLGDTITFVTRFVQDGVVVEIDPSGGPTLDLRFGIKNNLVGSNYLASNWNGSTYAFTKTGIGSGAYYSVNVTINSTDISALFNSSGDPISLNFALKWILTQSGVSTMLETITIPITVEYCVNLTTEGQVNPANPTWPNPQTLLTLQNILNADFSGLPTSDPGGGREWLNGGVVQVGP